MEGTITDGSVKAGHAERKSSLDGINPRKMEQNGKVNFL
jgi:hypothetical protein